MSEKELRNTLNLPETDFPMRANLSAREPVWVANWLEKDVYGALRAKHKNNPKKFILHLGPPYANGRFHMGHTLSYVLKDFVVRYKSMRGFDAPFVPGWDCHGLPIEWKVETTLREQGKSKNDLSTKELRDLCRAYATQWVNAQKSDWQRMGCLGDWDNPYLTMNKANEAGIVRELGRMVERGYVYKGVKSVMWSPVEETALAEAEVEYHDKESLAIFLKFALKGTDESVVIWTTTPWTIPANRAVAYGDDITYVCLEVTAKHEKAAVRLGEKLWLAEPLMAEVNKLCGIEGFTEVKRQQGRAFENMLAVHPLSAAEVPLLSGFHVTTESGTGFVHTAPSHGAEDFQIGQENGLDLMCHVQADGTYDATVTGYEGRNIWDAQKDLIQDMTEKGALLRWYKYTHSYPHSWRSKAPVIFRTTPQWFIALDNEKDLRHQTLRVIDTVNWIPSYGKNRISSMIEKRPDWCISRQRAWGVPITLFVHKHTGAVVADTELFEHIAALIELEGIDAWDSRIEEKRVAELFPEGWLAKHGVTLDELEPQRDILDVWIDSGTSHAHVLRAENARLGQESRFYRADGKRPADVYWEGSDQHRGWFHSSLLTSVAAYGDAPYETVLTHGFVVDGQGRKMSKSIGNGVEPEELLKKYGMDIVRLWIASADYSEDVRLSDEVMEGIADGYRRFRNTFRYVLGNLSDFDETTDMVPYDKLPKLEKWLLDALHQLLAEVTAAYDGYTFHRAYRALYNFCATELSNIYFDIRKDVLYCDAPNAPRRRSVQTVLMHLLRTLTTHLAPLMPFTTDEVWRSRFGDDACVHLENMQEADPAWENPALRTRFEAVWQVRDRVNMALEKARGAGNLGASLEAAVDVPLSAAEVAALAGIPMAEILIVSAYASHEGEGEVRVSKAAGEKCPRCWSYHTEMHAAHTEVCPRCGDALDAAKKEAAA